MKADIVVPEIGESVTEGVIANILKESGSIVKKDEEILEVETDKVNQVVYAPEEGKLQLDVKKDDTVKIGQVIGHVDPSEKVSSSEEEKKSQEPVTTEEKEKKQPQKEEEKTPKPPVPETEKTRMLPEDFVRSISSSPQDKKIPPSTKETPKRPKKEGEKREKMSSLRKTIAKRLVEVKNQTAMLTTFNEIDMSKVIELRKTEKEAFEKKHGVRLGFMSFFVKACVSALQELPTVNAFIEGEEIVYHNTQDIGIAVSTEKGLMVPVVRDCHHLSFAEIEKEIQEYAQKARKGTISLKDMEGGTFTITNGGAFGSLLSTPILNPPQSAILGMHNITKRAVVVEDQIVIRPMMYVALSYDHRIIDGKEAVTFLVYIKNLLEDPARILLEYQGKDD